jgi:phosphonoacetaldehyde hydrolase
LKLLNQAVPAETTNVDRLKAVVLDWAGTTVDFGSLAPVHTLREVFARAGMALNDSELRRDMGLPKKEHIRKILSMPRVQGAWHSLHGHNPGQSEVEELYQAFIPLQLSCLAEYSAVIPGVPEAIEKFRGRGLKIGSSTGYSRTMLDLLVEKSAKEGYRPDCHLAPEDVGAGRPCPFMMYENAVRLQVYPLAAIAKIGDTPVDVQEGLNAGTWSIGVASTGNMIGLSLRDFQTLADADRESRLVEARLELEQAGAHYVVDTLAEVPAVLEDIDARLRSTKKSY